MDLFCASSSNPHRGIRPDGIPLRSTSQTRTALPPQLPPLPLTPTPLPHLPSIIGTFPLTRHPIQLPLGIPRLDRRFRGNHLAVVEAFSESVEGPREGLDLLDYGEGGLRGVGEVRAAGAEGGGEGGECEDVLGWG